MTLREQIEALAFPFGDATWVRVGAVLDIIDAHDCEDRDDVRDACEAAGLPRDGALWLLLNTVRARALSDPSLRCSYGHSIDKVGTHRCIPDRDALARALPDVMSQEVCDAVMGRGHDPLDLVEEWYMTPRELADAIIAALREQS